MADRHTLHFSKLESFRKWLIKNDWELKPLSKSQYEVLRAVKGNRWVIVYKRDGAKEHYSLTDASISIVNMWLREMAIRKQVCEEIRERSSKSFGGHACNLGKDFSVYAICDFVLDEIEKGEDSRI